MNRHRQSALNCIRKGVEGKSGHRRIRRRGPLCRRLQGAGRRLSDGRRGQGRRSRGEVAHLPQTLHQQFGEQMLAGAFEVHAVRCKSSPADTVEVVHLHPTVPRA
ncbi:hypothetical protein J6590_083911 [Homalodisca vitripennis]|nr:hypothetical protein J6590_083911 [Homalodisca vitripennis]